MSYSVIPVTPETAPAAVAIWNQVVEDGVAFPQTEPLTLEEGTAFFAKQTLTAVAVDEDGTVLGIYILHPNNIGRCGHIANASYAVARHARGRGVGGGPGAGQPQASQGLWVHDHAVQRRGGHQHPRSAPVRKGGLYPPGGDPQGVPPARRDVCGYRAAVHRIVSFAVIG